MTGDRSPGGAGADGDGDLGASPGGDLHLHLQLTPILTLGLGGSGDPGPDARFDGYGVVVVGPWVGARVRCASRGAGDARRRTMMGVSREVGVGEQVVWATNRVHGTMRSSRADAVKLAVAAMAAVTAGGIVGCATDRDATGATGTTGAASVAETASASPASPPATTAADPDVVAVAGLLLGTFDSRAQSAEAPDDFFEIRLVTVPIWEARTDGRWLYVEQASFAALDRPYRQRVYRVHRDDAGVLRSDVYLLPGDPSAYTAAWTKPTLFSPLDPSMLELRDGCSILLEAVGDGSFVGATEGTGCSSALGDAAYATSEVELRPGLIVSWDRGWTADGEQAWGATEGGYRFVRQSAGPPAAEPAAEGARDAPADTALTARSAPSPN